MTELEKVEYLKALATIVSSISFEGCTCTPLRQQVAEQAMAKIKSVIETIDLTVKEPTEEELKKVKEHFLKKHTL